MFAAGLVAYEPKIFIDLGKNLIRPTHYGSLELSDLSREFLKIYSRTAFDIYDAPTPALGRLTKKFDYAGAEFDRRMILGR